VLRGRFFASLEPDDACSYCYYHLHRCEDNRFFDRIACLLGHIECHEPLPGRHCPAFTYLYDARGQR